MAEHTLRQGPGVRRNGKLRACEPCRKRKLVCDHSTPCGRCVKRKTTDDCFYHPAPLTGSTKISKDDRLAHRRTTTSPSKTYLPIVDHLESRTTSNSNPQLTSPASSVTESAYATRRASQIAASDNGFNGSSSSSAVVAEVLGTLGIPTPERPSGHLQEECVSDADIQRGIAPLMFLQNVDMIDGYLNRRSRISDSHLLYQPVYHIWMATVHQLFGPDARPCSLEALSRIVWHNTRKPLLGSNAETLREWAECAAGPNLRWETVGLLISVTGIMAGSLPGWDATFTDAEGPNRTSGFSDRPTMLRTTLSLVNACVAFAKQCDSRNDLTLALAYDCMLLHERVGGDWFPQAWNKMGEACDLAVHLGYHQLRPTQAAALAEDNQPQTPFFLAELRVRLFHSVYHHDKFLATFHGRPPRISYRHCVDNLPVDLSDAQMSLPRAELREAYVQLDPDGTTHEGPLSHSTWRRGRWPLRKLREDILELVLGSADDTEGVAEKLRERMDAAVATLPPFLTEPDPHELLCGISTIHLRPIPGRGGVAVWRPRDVLQFVTTHCMILHMRFVLERADFKRRLARARNGIGSSNTTATAGAGTGSVNATSSTAPPPSPPSTGPLIATAQALLRLALNTVRAKDYLREGQIDLLDMLLFYALPAAGVLAIEMLKREQNPSLYHQEGEPAFPRSEIVQQLSVLASALEAVDPTEGNYDICEMGLTAIRKVLDRVLSPPPPPSSFVPHNHKTGAESGAAGTTAHDFLTSTATTVAGAGAGAAGGFLDDSFHQFFGLQPANAAGDAEFMQWLGNGDFGADAWLEGF